MKTVSAIFKSISANTLKVSVLSLIAGAACSSLATATTVPNAEPSALTAAAPSALSAVLPTSIGRVNPQGALELKGSFAIWQRPVCDTGLNCEMPTAIAQPVAADVEFRIPLSFGASLVSISTYRTGSWKVELSLVWFNSKLNDPTPPYLVTQLRLSEDSRGVVAECSRYDGVADLKFLLPGSCSGRNGSLMFGVSTLSTP